MELKAYPRISFRMTVKRQAEMNYRIENLEAFRIVGLSAPLPKEIEQSFQVVPGLWQRAAEEGILERLCLLMDGQPAGILGVSACMEVSRSLKKGLLRSGCPIRQCAGYRGISDARPPKCPI